MREIRTSGSEGGGTKPIASPYPYFSLVRFRGLGRNTFCAKLLIAFKGNATNCGPLVVGVQVEPLG